MKIALRALAIGYGGFLSLVLGCGEVGSNLGEGKACYRSVQCAPGLACIDGECSSDLSSVGGTVPPPPMGMGTEPPPEAGVEDAAPGPDAAGEPDASDVVDAGNDDAGADDAGDPEPVDAGDPEPVDAGDPIDEDASA